MIHSEPLAPLGVAAWLDERLWNWGRWARVSGGSGLCMTGIVCARMAKEVTVFDAPTARRPIDWVDAQAVEKTWAGCASERTKIIVRSHYVVRVDYRDVARFLGFSFVRWDEELSSAARLLGALLEGQVCHYGASRGAGCAH